MYPVMVQNWKNKIHLAWYYVMQSYSYHMHQISRARDTQKTKKLVSYCAMTNDESFVL